MSLGGPGGDTDDVVAALRAVAGVFDAEILPDDTGGPGTLRLQLEPGADEVRVATTVHRLLGDQFGLGVDAGRVQVVEEAMPRRPLRSVDLAEPAPIVRPPEPSPVPTAVPDAARPDAARPDAGVPEGGRGGRHAARVHVPDADDRRGGQAGLSLVEEPATTAEPPRQTRLLIHRMQLVSARTGVSSEVSLERDGEIHSGYAEALSTTASVHRAVALATLRAVEESIGARARFELEHLETMPMGGEMAVVVEISMVTRIGTERLTGVSAVREDTRQAVIRATLDALNRRIETYLVSS